VKGNLQGDDISYYQKKREMTSKLRWVRLCSAFNFSFWCDRMKSEMLWLFFDRGIGNRYEAAEIKVSATYLWCDLKP